MSPDNLRASVESVAAGELRDATGEPQPQWFLVHTKSGAEDVARRHLERQGYGIYFPRLLANVLYRGRWVERISALFPRYLFVRLDAASQSLAPVRSTQGVAGLVCFGARTAVVPDRVVEGLKRRAHPESGLHELKRPMFEAGAPVHVISGPFAGVEGIFERAEAEDRVVVLFQLLGRETPVRIPAGYVVQGCAA